MKTLRDIANLKGVRVFLRADFNVPVRNGIVADDFRIKAALPTIEYLKSNGAKIIIGSHIEPINGEDATLKPVVEALEKLGVSARFFSDYDAALDAGKSMSDGECVLLENLRAWKGEKDKDEEFVRKLANLADIYVNDAFPVCHRNHASIVGVPKIIPAYAGLRLEQEVESLSKAFNPSHPFLFMLGGAKFETKMPLLNKFLQIADSVFVGGALANDLLKAKGCEVGVSTVSSSGLDLGPLLNNQKLIVPVDIVDEKGQTLPADGLKADGRILDAGSKTLDILRAKAKDSSFILWNGPLGLYEDGYRGPTLEVAKMLAEATSRGATTIVGGGDTVAAISSLNLEESFSFISTGGGAMLDFLAEGTLPGIEALG